jgi:hypothetical protein
MNATILFGATFLIGMFNCWTGRLNGRFFFGRTTAAEAKDSLAGRAITRQYLTNVVQVTLAAVGLVWMSLHQGHRSIASSAILLETAAVCMIFAQANGRVRELMQASPELRAATEPVIQVALLEQPTYWIPGVVTILLPLAICLVSFAAAVVQAAHGAALAAGLNSFGDSLDRLGDSFTLGMACGMLAAATGILLLFRSSVRLRTKMAQYSVRSSFAMEWIATALFVATVVSNRMGMIISRTMGKGLVGVALAIAVVTMVWNQARSKRFIPPPVELGADDRWRWGLFYVDSNDPALFVQSRCGAGYTLNYGRVAAWPISLGVVAYLVGVLFFLPHLH